MKAALRLTIRAFLLIWRALRTAEQQFGGRTPIGHIHIQPGKGDGVLDDGRNGRWRRRQIFGYFSGTVVGAPPDLPKRSGEERPDLVVRAGNGIRFPVVRVGRAAVVAEERGVPEYIAAAAHVHGVAEVTQRRADHVQREVAFIAALAVGVCDQAFEAWQLFLKIHGQRRWLFLENQTETMSLNPTEWQKWTSKLLKLSPLKG